MDKEHEGVIVINHEPIIVHQIRAIDYFDNESINPGELGGYVQTESNLSQEGACWIKPGNYVVQDASVSDDTQIQGIGCVICNNAHIDGHVLIETVGDVLIDGNAYITGMTQILGADIQIGGTAILTGNMCIERGARIKKTDDSVGVIGLSKDDQCRHAVTLYRAPVSGNKDRCILWDNYELTEVNCSTEDSLISQFWHII